MNAKDSTMNTARDFCILIAGFMSLSERTPNDALRTGRIEIAEAEPKFETWL